MLHDGDEIDVVDERTALRADGNGNGG